MLTRLKFEKLFGIFDYDISLMEDGVTIITGPNGYGKSTILRSINALRKVDIGYFMNLDFARIEFISGEQSSPIIVEKKDEGVLIAGVCVNYNVLTRYAERYVRRPYYRQVSDDYWMDRRTGEYINITESIQKKIEEMDIEELIEQSPFGYSEQEKELIQTMQKIKSKLEGIEEIKFISEQRLLKEELNEDHRLGKNLVDVVVELPDQFKKMMNEVSNKYSSEANKLDSTYPGRLFETVHGISKEDYETKLNSMRDKFEKLNEYDISEFNNVNWKIDFNEEDARALKIYIEDFDKKYKVFESLVSDCDLFTSIVNSRLKFKEIKISKTNGIVVQGKEDGRVIELYKLSSGEKQEIILFYELIFNTKKNAHILIDEPEISLHVEWQIRFMDDLLKIAEYKQLRVTVTTHSPQIIANHWDINIDLGELYG